MTTHSICILGGTGFVGRHLTAKLVEAGHNVTILSRNAERHRNLLVLPTVSLLEADVYDPDTLRRCFEGIDTVVNLVGILNERGRDGKGFHRAHVELVERVVAACRTAGVKRLLHMSSLKADPDNGPSHYLRSKGQGEAVVRGTSGDIHYTIFRPSIIFGPDDSSTNRFAALLKMLFVFPLARPNARAAPVFVNDVVNAFTTALDDRATYGQTYQLCGPQVYSLKELVQLVARTQGQRRWVIGLPDSLSRLQAAIMDFVPGKPFSTDNYRSLSVHSLCDQNGFEQLGITPRSLQAILPRYLNKLGKQERLSSFRKQAGR